MNTEKNILEEIKKRDIPDALHSSIIPILEKNLARIKFVKSFVGLKDVLYFEERGLEIYDYPLFLSLDCEPIFTEEDKYRSISSIYENAITDTDEIVRKIKNYFSNSSGTLYILAAVKENKLSNDDMWKVYHRMNEEPNKDPFDIMTKMYSYPEWYTAQYGETIAVFDNSFALLKEIEKKNLSSIIKQLKLEIDTSLAQNDLTNVSKLVKELKRLEKRTN